MSASSLTLSAPGYIGAGNAELFRDFPLSLRLADVDAVAHLDDGAFAAAQSALDVSAQLLRFHLQVDVVGDGVFAADHVEQCQLVAVLVGVDGVVNVHILRGFLLVSKIHEDLIFDTSCGIGREAGAFFSVEGGDRFDQADGADGDQIVLILGVGVVFFDDVCDQPEIALDEYIPRGAVPGLEQGEIMPLLRRGERPGERPGVCDMQNQVEQIRRGKAE